MSEITEDPQVGQGLTKASDQKHCFSCATILHVSAIQCPKCGAQQPTLPALSSPVIASAVTNPLQGSQVYCRGCALVIHESAISCPKCGAQQKNSFPNSLSRSDRKSRIAAVMLAFFLGAIGGHKFYLGQIGLGFLYLIFCWTFIPGIVAFIEGIYFLTMSDEAFERKYY
jgi:TM2 domain-containing membrane protein YozV/RNA polymerase subunit RPABC4/transcription elongation factor Spt4